MSVATLATPRVLAALRARLLADAELCAGLSEAPENLGGGPAIYTTGMVPAEARTDYLVIGPFTERDASTMGEGWGSDLTTAIKLVTQSEDVTRNLATMDRLMGLLHGKPLTVTGYASGYLLLSVMADNYTEWLSGKKLVHYPSLWEVHVSQVP